MADNHPQRPFPGHSYGTHIVPVGAVIAVAGIIMDKLVHTTVDHLSDAGSHRPGIGAIFSIG